MVYLAASLVSTLLLAGSLGLVFSTIRTSHTRIIGALLGQPMDQRIAVIRDSRPRRRITTVSIRPATTLRAAA